MTETASRSPNQSGSAWRNPWVLGFIGLVLTVLVANLTMVYLAIATNPGLVNPSYYERGRNYERSVSSRLAQDPGWVTRLDVPPDARVGELRTLRFTLVDRVGQPVAAKRIVLHAYRPSDASRDFSAVLEPQGGGRYAARVRFPLMGVWDTLVAVQIGAEEHLVGERIRIQGP